MLLKQIDHALNKKKQKPKQKAGDIMACACNVKSAGLEAGIRSTQLDYKTLEQCGCGQWMQCCRGCRGRQRMWSRVPNILPAACSQPSPSLHIPLALLILKQHIRATRTGGCTCTCTECDAISLPKAFARKTGKANDGRKVNVGPGLGGAATSSDCKGEL